jgi:hypothetical protein
MPAEREDGQQGRLIKFLVGQRLDRERNPTWLPFPPEKTPSRTSPSPSSSEPRRGTRSCNKGRTRRNDFGLASAIGCHTIRSIISWPGVVPMRPHSVKLGVRPCLLLECKFWLEDDGWNAPLSNRWASQFTHLVSRACRNEDSWRYSFLLTKYQPSNAFQSQADSLGQHRGPHI